MCHFHWWEDIHFFNWIGFFWNISLSHPFFHVRWFFNGGAAAIHFIQALFGKDNFWQQLLIKNSYFLEDLSYGFASFKGSLFISPLWLQTSSPWISVSDFVTKRITVIHSLKCAVFILTGKFIYFVIHCLSISISSSMFISKKALILAMCSFKGDIIISIEYSQPSILSTVLYIFQTLKFAAIQSCLHTFFQRISEHQSRWKNFLSKQLYFQSNIDYTEMKTIIWSSFFLVANTFSDQLLLQLLFHHSYCFGGGFPTE